MAAKTEIFEGPREVTTENVQYWCKHTKELKNSQVTKAMKFLNYGCIRYIGKAFEDKNNEMLQSLKSKYPEAVHIFVCLPLNTETEHRALGHLFYKAPYEANYNFSEYIIFKRQNGTFECNCQGWQSKSKRGEIVEGGANCSHILALYYAFKIGKFNQHHGAEQKHMEIDMGDEYAQQ